MEEVENNQIKEIKDMLTLQHGEFSHHKNKFIGFLTEWDGHQKEQRDTAKKVENIHDAILSFAGYASHLTSLSSINSAMQLLTGKLVDAATAPKVSESYARNSNRIFLYVNILLMAALILVLIRETNKNMSLGGKNGISISQYVDPNTGDHVPTEPNPK